MAVLRVLVVLALVGICASAGVSPLGACDGTTTNCVNYDESCNCISCDNGYVLYTNPMSGIVYCDACMNGGSNFHCNPGYYKGPDCNGNGTVDTQNCNACGNGGPGGYTCNAPGSMVNGVFCNGQTHTDTQTCTVCDLTNCFIFMMDGSCACLICDDGYTPTADNHCAPLSSSSSTGPYVASNATIDCGKTLFDYTTLLFPNEIRPYYELSCPASCTHAGIWGTGNYTLDSDFCTAALHSTGSAAGPFLVIVTVDMFRATSKRALLVGSTQNGVTSQTYSGNTVASGPAQKYPVVFEVFPWSEPMAVPRGPVVTLADLQTQFYKMRALAAEAAVNVAKAAATGYDFEVQRRPAIPNDLNAYMADCSLNVNDAYAIFSNSSSIKCPNGCADLTWQDTDTNQFTVDSSFCASTVVGGVSDYDTYYNYDLHYSMFDAVPKRDYQKRDTDTLLGKPYPITFSIRSTGYNSAVRKGASSVVVVLLLAFVAFCCNLFV